MGANLSFPTVELAGRVAIVTGSNTGTGYETGKALARMGAKVVLACRSQERAEQAIEKMRGEVPDSTLEVEFAPLDLSSFKSTVSFADWFLGKYDKLNILCCNAGYLGQNYRVTDDGFESVFQTNYLSHFVLITRFLPILKTSGPDSRIVSVASKAHQMGAFDLARTQEERQFGSMRTYGTSKLFQIMMTGALQRRLTESGVNVSSVHPGTVKTEFGKDSSVVTAFYNVGFALGTIRNAAEGAATIIYACVTPELAEQNHMYFESCKPAFSNALSRDEAKQEELFNYSLSLVKDLLSEDSVKILGIDLDAVTSPPPTGGPIAPPSPAEASAANADASAGAEASAAAAASPEAAPEATPAAVSAPEDTPAMAATSTADETSTVQDTPNEPESAPEAEAVTEDGNEPEKPCEAAAAPEAEAVTEDGNEPEKPCDAAAAPEETSAAAADEKSAEEPAATEVPAAEACEEKAPEGEDVAKDE
ncbi:retinol dehydrogenase 12-like isoform X2 [Sycon ciliatum]|uniref:retinol dehydrogenase 12-like isoform X2 n=1 Tax=Sycon ciliatum TaxID=27933 RepID=UPI0031F62807